MATRAYLYDATGKDREVPLTQQAVSDLHDKQLLWVDVREFDDSELRLLGTPVGIRQLPSSSCTFGSKSGCNSR